MSRTDNMLLPSATDPGPSRHPASSFSSPIAPEQSLFTPPPPARRRTRIFIDYVVAPPLPKGLTKADYQPMSRQSDTHPPVSPVTNTVRRPPVAGSPVKQLPSPSLQGQKGKERERERDVVSPHESHSLHALPDRADASSDALADAFDGPTEIPLEDEDTYPLLTSLDLTTNSRFQFAYTWRGNASRLREAELDCVFKFRLPEKGGLWADSVDVSSSPMPETAGFVSIKQLRPWKLASPHSPHDKSTKYVLDEHTRLEAPTVDADVPSPPDNSLPVPTPATDPTPSIDPTPSTSALSPGVSSTAVDTELDINRYFNGLSDSPSKHDSSRHHVTPTHTPHPQIQMNTLGLEFPSFELDPQLAATDSNESFFGVPPSPTPTDTESSRVPEPTPCSLFESASYFPASPGNLFAGDTLTDVWSLGEGLQLDRDASPFNNVLPTILGTIDPSLLGAGQLQTPVGAPPVALKDPPSKRRSKLPEPIVYVRRSMNSSSLPLVSGKRPVQIKYRDAGGSPATSLAQTESNEAFSNHAENPIELFTNDTNNSPRTKRCSVPSLKLREYRECGSDSEYIPETSNPKPNPKLNRPSVEHRASVVDRESKKDGIIVSSCHQCRNTTIRPKMSCSNTIEDRICGKRFCNRCILNRYPDITFDQQSAGFLCPACTNTCNCSVCSRNRGEEYISMRLGGFAASIFKTKVTLVRDVGEPLHRHKPPSTHVDERRSASDTTTPTPEPGTVSLPSQFWAHVYSMEGERMGSAFMTREQMERMQARGPSHPPPISISHPLKKAQKSSRPEKKREKIRRPRVFVGRPLASWKVHKMHDLEPGVDVEARWGEIKRQRDVAFDGPFFPSRRPRCYIGNPAPLHEPYGRMPRMTSPTPFSSRDSSPERDSDRSVTPLSELEVDNWPQPAVGEGCSWVPPGATMWGPLQNLEPLLGPMGEAELDGRQGQISGSSGSGSGTGEDVMDMGLGIAAEGAEPRLASTLAALSQEDMARAISAALAMLTVDPAA